MFTESDFESLLRQTPFQPKAGNNIYQKLRLGIRKVILAVVDQGVTSYINIADAGFGNEKLHEREPGRRGGKQGGFRGKGRGRGRGRG
jgi:tRNA-splicing endonuclease subunit Sen54